VIGSINTPGREVSQVSSSLGRADHWGAFKARCGVGRMHYTVDPGLYALGNPDKHSPVLVTASYKMSFDKLRESLPGRDAWILVLDTSGINVWCAAGAGTFGTEELVTRIQLSGLDQIVSHRELIVPQLGAPGIKAHVVENVSGFRVTYGPIKAKDLPSFLDAGHRATPEMRCKTFTAWERAILIPVEIVTFPKLAMLIILILMFFLGGFMGKEGFWPNALNHGLFAVIGLLAAILAGAVFTPLLLPWLPGRAFSLKGMTVGFIVAGFLLLSRLSEMAAIGDRIEMLAWFFLIPAIAAYLAMNFTGASTYTSLSGVKKEIRWALPFEIGAGIVGLSLWIGTFFIA
jgi:acetyl-CoA decarbonylase/synthase complex subunit gamma